MLANDVIKCPKDTPFASNGKCIGCQGNDIFFLDTGSCSVCPEGNIFDNQSHSCKIQTSLTCTNNQIFNK